MGMVESPLAQATVSGPHAHWVLQAIPASWSSTVPLAPLYMAMSWGLLSFCSLQGHLLCSWPPTVLQPLWGVTMR